MFVIIGKLAIASIVVLAFVALAGSIYISLVDDGYGEDR